ncbi:MAG: alpha/beta hydrolase [Pigmentiphaga sp.]|uniref:alpha/beta hydrolase n=1 Tax=Pigmentiphaga sp. TaxID=1977564 RepID=UPI0029AFBB18|nr:alpha/beta hydrolase [Pigmentiphaga sp.]MDX3905165.1 alpha/beta hydrolase [Pigmentiphaga sp.]
MKPTAASPSPWLDGTAAMPPLAGVDPALATLQGKLKADGCAQADPTSLPLADARAQQDRYFAAVNADLPAVESVRDLVVAAPGRDIRARLYRPQAARDDAFAVFVRGAGWWAGGLDSHEGVCRGAAHALGRPVLALDYRRSPESVFPAQRDDVVAATAWLLEHAADLGLPPRAVLWGESAGASLCVLAWRQLQDQGVGEAVPALVLFYGNLGGPRENLRPQSKWVWRQYLGPAWESPPAAAIPCKTDLRDFPPVWLGVGDADPLIEDSFQFAKLLHAADRPHRLHVYSGMPHGFSAYARQSAIAEMATADAAAFADAAIAGSL